MERAARKRWWRIGTKLPYSTAELCAGPQLHGRSGPKDEESRKKCFRDSGMAGTGQLKNRILFDPSGFFFPEERREIDPSGSGFRKCLKLKPVMKLTDDGTRIDKFFENSRTMLAAVHGIINYLKEKGIGSAHFLHCSCRSAGRGREYSKYAGKSISRAGDSFNGAETVFCSAGRSQVHCDSIY